MILKQLEIGYKSSAPITEAIDAELCLGTFVCLIGRNGTGKSTLLRTLADLQKPLDGSFSNENCAIVLTKTPELQNTTVFEMVAYGRLRYTGLLGSLNKADLHVVQEAITAMGIVNLSQRNFATLSDGERQKVMIARALAQGTDYILLDEPSAFLDYPSKVELMESLRTLAHSQHKGVLLSTHDLELAVRFADILWELNPQPLQLQLHEPQPPRLFFRTIPRNV